MSRGSTAGSGVSRSWSAAVLLSAVLAGSVGCGPAEPAKEGSRAPDPNPPGSNAAASGPASKEAYLRARATLIEKDRLVQCGARLGLSDGEDELNDFLVRLRDEMIAR